MQQNKSNRLVLDKQESLAVDHISRNGFSKDLYFVAKNIPFNLHVSSSLNLNQAPIVAKLYYDFDRLEDQKEVETLKNNPLHYTAHVNETGDRAVLEVRISVLSSQHEGAFFRIRLSVKDPKNNEEVVNFSLPIKVISKRNQVRRMIEKQEVQPTEPLPAPKRTSSDMITDALTRLEEQQREQAKLLKQLLIQKNTSKPTAADTEDDFESAFKKFINAYQKVPSEERPSKIRKVIKQTQINPAEAQSLSDFVSIYSVDMLPNGLSSAEQNFMKALMEIPPSLLTHSTGSQNGNVSDGFSVDSEPADDTAFAQFLADPLFLSSAYTLTESH